MDFLEDILQRYGIKANYWPSPEDSQRTETIAPADTTRKDAMNAAMAASENWRDEMLLVDLASSRIQLFVQLADLRAKGGKLESALKAYEAAVLEDDDAQRLCELGYLLLQRCRVDELPVCDKDFDGSFFDFGDGETLFISSYMSEFDNPGPEFPDKPALRGLAIRALGLAYVRCVQRYRTAEKGATWEDRWHELVALDGLRAAFLAADDLEGLEAVRVSFNCWIEDYGDEDEEAFPGRSIAILWMLAHDGHLIEFSDKVEWDPEDDPDSFLNPFVANFNRTTAYLRGRRKAAPLPVSEERLRHLILTAIHSGIEPVRGDLQAIKELGEAGHRRLDLIVEKLIDLDQRSELTWEHVREFAKTAPEAEKNQVRDRLEAIMRHVWSRLDSESQGDVIDAEIVSAICMKLGSAWRCAVIGYCTAAERELAKTIDHFRKSAVLPSRSVNEGSAQKKVETFGDQISTLTNRGAWGEGRIKGLSADIRLIFDNQNIKRLWELNKIRTRAAHPQKSSKADVLKVQELLLQPRDEAKPLLSVIAQARGSS